MLVTCYNAQDGPHNKEATEVSMAQKLGIPDLLSNKFTNDTELFPLHLDTTTVLGTG